MSRDIKMQESSVKKLALWMMLALVSVFAVVDGAPLAGPPQPGQACFPTPWNHSGSFFTWYSCAKGMMCDGLARSPGLPDESGSVEMQANGFCCTVNGGCHKCFHPDAHGRCSQSGSGLPCKMGQTCNGQCEDPSACTGSGCYRGAGSCYVVKDTQCSGSCT